MVAIGGIGEKHARRAAEVVIEHAQPGCWFPRAWPCDLPKLKVGDVGRIRESGDVSTGERYSTRGGEWCWLPPRSERSARSKAADQVRSGRGDMEGAAEAQVAKERGLEFAAVKAISDDAAFVMPPLNRFIDGTAGSITRRFLFI